MPLLSISSIPTPFSPILVSSILLGVIGEPAGRIGPIIMDSAGTQE